MKTIRLLLIILCTLTFSCNRYDDSAIWDELQSHSERIAALEALCSEMNSNIEALENIVTALQANEYVTGITDITEDGKVIGYTITFSKSGRVAIYHGKDGAAGAPGLDGADGANGADGKDGHTPVIGVRKDADGVYYWTLDGEWLTDSKGDKIPTTGADGTPGQDGADGKPGQDGENGQDGKPGADGTPGQDGANGITPLLKIENEYWYVSYNNGQTWEKLYKAVGENGKDGQNGDPGKDGQDGTSFFQSVDTTNPNYIILTLADGSQIKIPTWKAFEDLQIKVNKLNTNLTALQAIIEALESNVYVTEVSPIMEDGKEAGYIIYLSDGKFISIYHGKAGSDGVPGQDGEAGKDGADGKDGHTPVIGIRKATDEDWSLDNSWAADSPETYYWTIDGEWLLDSDGNRIPATGPSGSTPTLKIENGNWFISLDDGKSWNIAGPATGNNVENIFTDITYDLDFLYITLINGELLVIARHHSTISVLCDIAPVEITDLKATFTGHIYVSDENIAYTQAILYYSNIEPFNIYTAEKISTSKFDYNQSFEFTIDGLTPETKYNYCICAKVRQEETYGAIKSFMTDKQREYRIRITTFHQGEHGFVNVTNGVITRINQEASQVLNFYEIPTGAKQINYPVFKTSSVYGSGFQDSDGNWISGYGNLDGTITRYTLDIPENAAVFVLTYPNDKYAEVIGVPPFDYIEFIL